MSVPVTDVVPPPPRRRLSGALWFLLLIAFALAALVAWQRWSQRVSANADEDAVVDLRPEAIDARLLQAEASIAALRRNQETMNQKLTDTRARTGLLRDEVLAVGQRSSLVEDSMRDLAAGSRDGMAALRLDEVEALLVMAGQRLDIAADRAGAIRATQLAHDVLATQQDPSLLDLRQSLAQELAALRAAPADPSIAATAALDALERALPRMAVGGALGTMRQQDADTDRSGLQRLLDSLVQVRRGETRDLLSSADRGAGEAALALEIALARTALQRGDRVAFSSSLSRIDGWLQRMYRDGKQLRALRGLLRQLRGARLGARPAIAGSTLAQLHELQLSRRRAP